MAGSNTISITYKIDGDNRSFKELAKDADSLKQVLTNTLEEARTVSQSINFAAVTQSIEAAQSALTSLRDAMQDLGQAYAVQAQAEAQLEVTMRNRMGATDEMIQSVKDLASAQQQLGVIGDEVQLAGAQEMAMFLSQKESIDLLLPAMNDLLAQQKGFNATGADAVSVAKAMGKAMEGNTTALTRMGVTLTDAQQEIMKHGTESEKAATLADALKSSVGGMNAELAKTDAGKQKQLENALGDVKERLGELTNSALPFVTMAANSTIALMGIMKLITGFRGLIGAIKAINITGAAYNVVCKLIASTSQRGAAYVRFLGTSMKGASVQANILKWSIRGLLISSGVGLAIMALTWVIEKLCAAADNASDSMGEMTEAQQRAQEAAQQAKEKQDALNKTYTEAKAEIDVYMSRLRNFNGTKQEEARLVEELNNKYGDTLGTYQSIAAWYDVLSRKSEIYARHILNEAKMRSLANEVAQAELDTKKAYQLLQSVSTQGGQTPEDFLANASHPFHLILNEKGEWSPTPGIFNIDERLKDSPYGGDLYTALVQAQTEDTRAYLTHAFVEALKKEEGLKKEYNESVEAFIKSGEQLADGLNVNTSTRRGGGGSGRPSLVLIKNPQSDDEWENNRKYHEAARGAAKDDTTRREHDEAINLIEGVLAYRKDRAAFLKGISGNVASVMSKSFEDVFRDRVVEGNNLPLSTARHNISVLQNRMQGASPEDLPALAQQLKTWQDYEATLQDIINTASIATGSLKDYDHRLAKNAEEMQHTTDPGRVSELNAERKSLERARAAYANLGANVVNPQAATLQEIEDNIEALTNKLQNASIAEAAAINKEILLWQKKADAIRNAGRTQSDWYAQLKSGWGLINGVTSSLNGMVEAINGTGSAWSKALKIMDGLFSIADAIMGLVKLIQDITEATKAGTVATEAATAASSAKAIVEASGAAATVVAEKAKASVSKDSANALMAEAAASVIASNAYLGFAGIAKAAALIGLQQALFVAASIPKFAKGGIAYGPTLGLFGEYTGASRNPEVVAPLDRLRDMIQPTGFPAGKVKFTIEGRTLVGVLEKESNLYSRR